MRREFRVRRSEAPFVPAQRVLGARPVSGAGPAAVVVDDALAAVQDRGPGQQISPNPGANVILNAPINGAGAASL